jgi:predicted ATP-dependent Lon-type protease
MDIMNLILMRGIYDISVPASLPGWDFPRIKAGTMADNYGVCLEISVTFFF